MKNQASNDSSTFIIACNDYYSKQNSLKIRNVLDSKRKEGKFIGSKPCYGYMKDPKDKGHLIPDNKVAKYVKLIFEWKLNNISISEIATKLTNIGAPTPASYKKLSTTNKWTTHAVHNILKNRMYTGDMVQHKETNASYKSKKKITLDESLWIIVENTHEALVDKDSFMLINKNTKNKTRTYSKRKRPERLLEGLLFCHECGNRLSILYRKKQNYWCINCNRYTRDPIRKLCTSHFFAYDYFEELILKELKKLLSKLFDDLDIKELNKEIIKRAKNNSNNYEKRKKDIVKELNKLLETIKIIYKDRLDGNITPDQYKLLSKPYESKLKDLKKQLKNIDFEIKTNINKSKDYTNKIKELLDINNHNKELLLSLIERIETDKNRNIIIKFRYDILNTYIFKYKDNRIHNPYGRKGKNSFF